MRRSRIGARKPPSAGRALRAYAQVAAGAPHELAIAGAHDDETKAPTGSYVVKPAPQAAQPHNAVSPAGVSGRIERRRR